MRNMEELANGSTTCILNALANICNCHKLVDTIVYSSAIVYSIMYPRKSCPVISEFLLEEGTVDFSTLSVGCGVTSCLFIDFHTVNFLCKCVQVSNTCRCCCGITQTSQPGSRPGREKASHPSPCSCKAYQLAGSCTYICLTKKCFKRHN